MTRRKAAPKGKAGSDSEILDELIQLILEDIRNKGGRFKVAELLKTLEVKRKLAPNDDRERLFWEMIDRIRVEELPNKNSEPEKPAVAA